MEMIDEFCPAKVNLFLAITGRRSDGFHELVSLMAPLDVGDRLRIRLVATGGTHLTCSDPSLPCDERNLVWQAVEVFRQRYPFPGGVEVELEKRVPVGAGLGGGSSDAVGLLRGLNRILGFPLGAPDLLAMATTIGSDCPFFLEPVAAVVRGRGERISRLPERACARLRGTRLLLIKPSFSVSTPWAYGAMAKSPEAYCGAEEAEARLAEWLNGTGPVRDLLFNQMESVVYRKYIPLPVLKDRLEAEANVPVVMSGSGSTLFALVEDDEQRERAERVAREALGEAGWLAEGHLV